MTIARLVFLFLPGCFFIGKEEHSAALAANDPAITDSQAGGDSESGPDDHDVDGDGFLAGTSASSDCDDEDPEVHPGAAETCDSRDENCDGAVNEGLLLSWYADADGDGAGTDTDSVEACDAPEGYAAVAGDCDDDDPTVYLDATELLDGVDNDCDLLTDEGTDAYDDDNDGFSEQEWDCDDTDPTISPGAEEAANLIDDNCDGVVDEGTTAFDDDVDGLTEDEGDCDDTNVDVRPGLDELANGVDEDCDGLIDDGTSIYDDDGDGQTEEAGDCDDGNPDVWTGMDELEDGLDNDCDGIIEGTSAYDDDRDGQTEDEGDCDDDNANRSFGATEVFDSVDNDCDEVVDEGTAGYDDDADGVTEVMGDCDDGSSATAPGAEEVADAQDNDCDGVTDEGTELYDDDGDGLTETTGDCDDGNAAVYSGAIEAADGIDNDCDGIADGTGAYDDDGDGFTDDDGDCDDQDPLIGPNVDERCNLYDDDCDGTVDVDAVDAQSWYPDLDGDGYGEDSAVELGCTVPATVARVGGDCDDDDSESYPGAPESDCADPVDHNCDGIVSFVDDDLDGYAACVDCDDDDRAVSPGAAERCSTSVDDNCDGEANEYGSIGCTFVDLDADGDGYAPEDAVCVCDPGSVRLGVPGDCDDTDRSAYLGATEVCGDASDEDCNGYASECGAIGEVEASALAIWTLEATLTNERLGLGVGAVGEVTGDGVQDLAIGDSSDNTAFDRGGAIWIFSDVQPGSELVDADALIRGTRDNEQLSRAYGGDFDGDGQDDLVVGPWYRGSGVFSGPLTGLLELGDQHSFLQDLIPLLAVSDVTGNGTDDLLVYQSGSYIEIMDGPLAAGTLTAGDADYRLSALTGLPDVQEAGDVDGDGINDLVFGDRSYSLTSTEQGVGGVLSGPIDSSRSLTDADLWVLGATEGAAMGAMALSPGDLDDDGLFDVVFGAPPMDCGIASSCGAAYVFLGGTTGSIAAEDASTVWIGEPNTSLGGIGARVGDVDGDGKDDVLVAAESWSDGSLGVRGYVWVGVTPGTAAVDSAWALLDGLGGEGSGALLAEFERGGDLYLVSGQHAHGTRGRVQVLDLSGL